MEKKTPEMLEVLTKASLIEYIEAREKYNSETTHPMFLWDDERKKTEKLSKEIELSASKLFEATQERNKLRQMVEALEKDTSALEVKLRQEEWYRDGEARYAAGLEAMAKIVHQKK